MPAWNKENWARLYDGSECPIGLRGEPLGIVSELPASWLTADPRVPLRGTVCIVCRWHAPELHELPLEKLNAFMADVSRISRIVQKLTGAVKMNYEIHGNTIPRLHLHLYPRQRGDAFDGRPIDWKGIPQSAYSGDDFERYCSDLKAAIAWRD